MLRLCGHENDCTSPSALPNIRALLADADLEKPKMDPENPLSSIVLKKMSLVVASGTWV
jgi:hypothetical protein